MIAVLFTAALKWMMFKNENIIIEYNTYNILYIRIVHIVLCVGGAVDRRRERVPAGEGGAPTGGGGPRSGLPDLQSALAFWPQTLLHSALALALP